MKAQLFQTLSGYGSVALQKYRFVGFNDAKCAVELLIDFAGYEVDGIETHPQREFDEHWQRSSMPPGRSRAYPPFPGEPRTTGQAAQSGKEGLLDAVVEVAEVPWIHAPSSTGRQG